MDEFKKCVPLIVAGSFVIILNRQQLPTPLTRPQLALKLRTIEPQVEMYWFLYRQACDIFEVILKVIQRNKYSGF